MYPVRPEEPGRHMVETVPYPPFPETPARASVNRPPNRKFPPVGPVGGVLGAWPVYRVHVTWGAPEPTHAGNTPTLSAYRRAWIHGFTQAPKLTEPGATPERAGNIREAISGGLSAKCLPRGLNRFRWPPYGYLVSARRRSTRLFPYVRR